MLQDCGMPVPERMVLPMAQVILRKGKEEDILLGSLWVYDNEIERTEGECSPGDIVDVVSARGGFLGRGYINPRSKIRVRLMTRERTEVDAALIAERLAQAVSLRRTLGLLGNDVRGDRRACRLVFGEADFLPALVVDRFADVLVLQTVALGIERFKADIVRTLADMLVPRCIYERNDVPLREKEGLAQQKGVLFGEAPGIVAIEENGLSLLVDVENGQKTGYFLDQRENRAAIRPFVGDTVLDCFCHTGGFALNAAHFGAKAVEAVDISAPALELTQKNAALNGFEQITTKEANVFDLLKAYQGDGKQFNTVILDPPAFCKNRAALKGAWRGYKEINLRGMRLTRPGGYLITCSCSHYMTPPLFLKMLAEAAQDTGRRAQVVELRFQAKDHPFIPGEEGSLYLKCAVLRVE